MNKKKKKKFEKYIMTSIIINSLIFISTAFISVAGVLYGASDAQPGTNVIGAGYFKPFTNDSNILAGICALLVIIYDFKSIKNQKDKLPKYMMILHLMATTSIMLTFLVTMLFLTPRAVIKGQSIFYMYKGYLMFFHFVNPLLSLLSFINITNKYKYTKEQSLYGLVPTFIYSVVYVLLVVVFKKWDDFYGFTFNGRLYVVPFVFLASNIITQCISYSLTRIHNKKNRIK